MRDYRGTPTIHFNAAPYRGAVCITATISGANLEDEHERARIALDLCVRIERALNEAAIDREEQRAAQDASARLRLVAGGRDAA